MPKYLIVLIVVGGLISCLVLGVSGLALFHGFNTGMHWQKINAGAGGIAVFADRTIPHTRPVVEDDLVELKVGSSNTPFNSLLCRELGVGEKLVHNVERGKVVHLFDFGFYSNPEKKQGELLSLRKFDAEPICKHPIQSSMMSNKSRAVYVKIDIKENQKFSRQDLEYKTFTSGNLPDNAVQDIWQASNRISNREIQKGELLSVHDFVSSEDQKVSVFKAVKDSEKDSTIENSDIKEVVITTFECPTTAILDRDFIVGHKVFQPIKKGNIIKAGYLD